MVHFLLIATFAHNLYVCVCVRCYVYNMARNRGNRAYVTKSMEKEQRKRGVSVMQGAVNPNKIEPFHILICTFVCTKKLFQPDYSHIFSTRTLYCYYYYSRSWKQAECHYWHIICLVVHGLACIFLFIRFVNKITVPEFLNNISTPIRYIFRPCFNQVSSFLFFNLFLFYNKNLIIYTFFSFETEQRKVFTWILFNFILSLCMSFIQFPTPLLLFLSTYLVFFSSFFSLVSRVENNIHSDYFSHKLI